MSTRTRRGLASAITLMVASIAVAAPAADDWPAASPGAAGLDATTLAALDADLASGKYSLVDSVDVYRCGAHAFGRTYAHDYGTLYAKQARTRGPLNARLSGRYNYFDPAWHPYHHGSDLHTMQSVSKTVTSAVFGVAIARGDFKASLDTPVLHWFDAARVRHVDARKQRLTLRHVLTMTTGLAWVEDVPYDDPRSDSSLMEATDDWVRYVIDKPMAAEPGTVFNYSSGASELLAHIFRRETGQDIERYAERHLFGPLGMRHVWKRTYRGEVDTEGGLYLSPGDLAKLGRLYLQGGEWQGRRLLDAAWVHDSLSPAIATGWQGLEYGYQWWLQRLADGGEPVWHAIGFGGQRLMVFPDHQLIAVFTGWDILGDPAFDAELAARVQGAARGACPAPMQ